MNKLHVWVAALVAVATLGVAAPALATEIRPASPQPVAVQALPEAPADKAMTVFALPARAVAENGLRVVNVYRARQAAQYVWRGSRVSDSDSGIEPFGVRDVVRVEVEITDPSPSRGGDDQGPTIVVFTLDPATLTTAQTAALDKTRHVDRVTPFRLAAEKERFLLSRVDPAASRFCDGDHVRCEDEVVYRQVPTDILSYRFEA